MRKLFLAFPILLLASCQSERVAFRFQSVAPTAGYTPRAAAAPAGLVPLPGSALAAPAPAETAAPLAVARQPRRPRLAARSRQAQATLTAPLALATPAPTTRPLQRLLLKRLVRQRATAGPARTAENGLGGIALFFIAVVLGLLAGLGALVSLIPGVSFLGGVGLAAAGLLVLFLLYSLLSGGKKQQKPAK